jgi:membrane-associated phospholipid phosphatase
MAFPSGHTSATFATASVLHARYGWKTGLAAYGAASFVGWSRVRDRKHWLSDVIVGGAIGILSGRAVTADQRTSRWALTPIATLGGIAIAVSKE